MEAMNRLVPKRRPCTTGSMRDGLKLGRKAVHAARAGRGDLDGLGEHAPGLALTPVRVEQVDVEREHHARLKTVADDLDRLAVGRDGVMAEARVFQRCQAVAV